MQQDLYSSEAALSLFVPEKSRLDVEILTEEGERLEYHQDSHDYTYEGGQVEVDPDKTAEGYDRLVQVIYYGYNPFFLGQKLQIAEISEDRKQIKLYAANLTNNTFIAEIAKVKQLVGTKKADLTVEVEEFRTALADIATGVLGNRTIAKVELVDYLPAFITLENVVSVLDYLGSADFTVEPSTESAKPVQRSGDAVVLRSPNFDTFSDTKSVTTDYLNSLELLQAREKDLKGGPYSTFREAAQHVSVNYEDFSDFIHFSSAVERLENARYKFEKIFECQNQIQNLPYRDPRIPELERQVEGIIDSFDHYENYLWYESSSVAWPKRSSARPYRNDDRPSIYEPWYDDLLAKAEAYDNTNKDILISTIPAAIREDEEHNEPYVVFIHMIGQHFDDIWLCAKNLSDRYKGDNRLNFGISKEFVKDALNAFGVQLYESNQNLTGLFELCTPDKEYTGEEVVNRDGEFRQIALEQPILDGNYTKEVYKRIYHNIPALLKMKGTSRGLRVLLNCFGIPNDLLTFRVQGGTDYTKRPFFGPEESVDIVNQNLSGSVYLSPANSKKVRKQSTEHFVEYNGQQFFTQSILSRFTSVTRSAATNTDDSHKLEVGFDLNEAANKYLETLEDLEDFTIDDIIGDPRNTEDQYGSNVWKALQTALLADLAVNEKFRAPAAIIRLVRYIDLTFFRMLKDFVPARASIDSGVIVKDNILHRNRYRGAQCETTTNEHPSDTIDTGFITGSHGGSIVGDVGITASIISTGDRYIPKIVTSGSLKYTGELSGSQLNPVHLDLTRFNEHRKLHLEAWDFKYESKYLDLPDIALNSCINSTTDYCEIYNIGPRLIDPDHLIDGRDAYLETASLAVSGSRNSTAYSASTSFVTSSVYKEGVKNIQVWTKKSDKNLKLVAEPCIFEDQNIQQTRQALFLGWFLTTTGSSTIHPGIYPPDKFEGGGGIQEGSPSLEPHGEDLILYPESKDVSVYRPCYYVWPYTSASHHPRRILVELIDAPSSRLYTGSNTYRDIVLAWKSQEVSDIDEEGQTVTSPVTQSVLGPVHGIFTEKRRKATTGKGSRGIYDYKSSVAYFHDDLFFGKTAGVIYISDVPTEKIYTDYSRGWSGSGMTLDKAYLDHYNGPFEYSGSFAYIEIAKPWEYWSVTGSTATRHTIGNSYHTVSCTYSYNSTTKAWQVYTE